MTEAVERPGIDRHGVLFSIPEIVQSSGKMDPRVQVFRRQYLQQVDFAMLRFPHGDLLLQLQVQGQVLHLFSDGVSEAVSPLQSNIGKMRLPPHSYQKRVLKEITSRMEKAIENPDEDGISNDLMGRMASLSLVPSLPSSMPEAAQLRSIVTYILPQQDLTAKGDEDYIYIEESRSLLAAAGTTSHRTWEASLHLAMYLLPTSNNNKAEESLVNGKYVLELGAGAGLLSIICAGPLSAAHVLVTDGDEDICERINKNVGLNQHLALQTSPADSRALTLGRSELQQRILPIDAKVLEWGDSVVPLRQRLLPNGGPNSSDGNNHASIPVQYDLILGADITYSLDSLEALALTLNDLADLYPKATILLSATIRNVDTFDSFLKACKQRHRLKVEEVEDFRCPRFEEQRGLFHMCHSNPPIRIVRVRK